MRRRYRRKCAMVGGIFIAMIGAAAIDDYLSGAGWAFVQGLGFAGLAASNAPAGLGAAQRAFGAGSCWC